MKVSSLLPRGPRLYTFCGSKSASDQISRVLPVHVVPTQFIYQLFYHSWFMEGKTLDGVCAGKGVVERCCRSLRSDLFSPWFMTEVGKISGNGSLESLSFTSETSSSQT